MSSGCHPPGCGGEGAGQQGVGQPEEKGPGSRRQSKRKKRAALVAGAGGEAALRDEEDLAAAGRKRERGPERKENLSKKVIYVGPTNSLKCAMNQTDGRVVSCIYVDAPRKA